MNAPALVFDIETIPDIAGLRSLRGLEASVSDADVLAAELAERKASGKSEMLPLYLQRVLVISCVYRSAKGLTVQSFADRSGSEEGAIIQTFFDKIEKHQPQLVSWNGGGFDLPVLHYRGLKHGVVADKYWDLGEDDREYKWNNYISRYHTRHLDMMDLLALYQPRANAPLDAMAKLCGLPGQAGHGRLAGLAGLPGRPAGRHPPLLRNRCHEHLAALLPLPEDARRLHRGRARTRACVRARNA